MIKYKWITSDSEDGERTYKQHCVIEVISYVPYTEESYIGNKMLCMPYGVSDGYLTTMKFDDVDEEEPDVTRCRRCIVALKKLINKKR